MATNSDDAAQQAGGDGPADLSDQHVADARRRLKARLGRLNDDANDGGDTGST